MLSLILLMLEDTPSASKFENICKEYEKRIFTIAHSYTKDFHEAEDITQTVLFILAQNIDKIDEENIFKTKAYIYTITKNTSINSIKKKHVPTTDEYNDFEADEPTVYDILSAQETKEELERCINEMPEIYRDVMKLFYVNELKIKEISKSLSLKESTVKTHLSRARVLLAKNVKKEKIFK